MAPSDRAALADANERPPLRPLRRAPPLPDLAAFPLPVLTGSYSNTYVGLQAPSDVFLALAAVYSMAALLFADLFLGVVLCLMSSVEGLLMKAAKY